MKNIVLKSQRQWIKNEKRMSLLENLKTELDNLADAIEHGEAEKDFVFETKFYQLIRQELEMLSEEQSFIESLGVLNIVGD